MAKIPSKLGASYFLPALHFQTMLSVSDVLSITGMTADGHTS
jgi:hypothetical protein